MSRKAVTFEGGVDDYVAYLSDLERSRRGKLMAGYKPPKQKKGRRRKRTKQFPEWERLSYFHRTTTNRVVDADGKVWCTTHNEMLREYQDRRGTIQRKCRSCANEYMRAYKARVRSGQGGEKPTRGRLTSSPSAA
jgi:hypothetical protein